MATKKAASKKGGAKKGAASAAAPAQGGVQFSANDRQRIDDASRLIAQAVRRAVASQPTGSKIRNPIILGIWFNPKTKEVEIINQFEQ